MIGRSDYEERRAARIERLRERAERLQSEGRLSLASAQRISAMIPFGQPILVGHHSEKRHRKDLERIRNGYDRGYETLNKAAELASRAESAERNDAISSDDPNALVRLREKRAKLEKERDDAKTINKLVRAAKSNADKLSASLKQAGFEPTPSRVLDLISCEGIPSYKLTNIGSEIRRLDQRIKILESEAERENVSDVQIGDITLSEGDNRVRLVFPAKPGEKCREALKSRGFKWSPSAGAWQRLANASARHVAESLAETWKDTWST
jgi:Domain of unknown function (DUF3560)